MSGRGTDSHLQLLMYHLQRADQTLTAAVNEAARAEALGVADAIDHQRAALARIRAALAHIRAHIPADAPRYVDIPASPLGSRRHER